MGDRRSIAERQNDDDCRLLLRAAFAAHERAQRVELALILISVAVAGLAIVAAFVPRFADGAAVLGGLWALLYAAGKNWSRGETTRAATVQEMFDAELFALPWNAVAAGPPLEMDEINRLARRYHGGEQELRDYYEVPDLPRPFDVLACQQQNLGWGLRVRARYGRSLALVLVVWSALGLTLGALADVSVAKLVIAWFIPSLGALLLGADIMVAQREITGIRGRVLTMSRRRVGALLAQDDPAGAAEADRAGAFARQVQDAILATRQRQVRVPQWFFHRFRGADRADFHRALTAQFGRLMRPE